MREGITENSQIRTICQVGQRAGDAGCSPGGWHSEHGDDTPRYHSQARPAQSQATRGSIPAVQASQRAACALRDALAQQAHTGVRDQAPQSIVHEAQHPRNDKTCQRKSDILNRVWDVPGGTVDKNLPGNAGDMGAIPGLRRSHML